ncbi:MAG: tripartite tricarboxylate transporter permease [Rhizobiales bacterium]|nr:tripartite tricarboxylate transporter permease [Hyphomicrobiales bacterium]
MLSELVANLGLGFSMAVTPVNLVYCLVGVFLGTLIGILPGLGPIATIAMLLPVSYGLDPLAALILIAGVYYGAQYGGSTTAILVNMPGEASSVVTCLDGYQMARKGRAGAALSISAMGSFVAGTVGTLLLAAFAVPLGKVALSFGPAEYFSLMVLGMIAAVVLAKGSVLKAIGMILVGIVLGLVGLDINAGTPRFSFDIPELADGINTGIIALAMFGIGDIIVNLERQDKREIFAKSVSGLWLTATEFVRAVPAVLRGTGLGSMLGVLPGGGATLSSFAAYSLEKKISKNPQEFGHGAIEGVAGPEAANNAAAQTSFIPLLTLGLPSNAVMALMVSAMTIHQIQPGPQVMTNNPSLFWGLIASMWVGNLMLVILNLPLIGLWIKMLSVPYRLLYPAILLFCCIGTYSLSNSPFDAALTAVLGVLGYLFAKLDCETAPLLLGFVLGPMMEESLRRALLVSRGDPSILVTRPISATILLIALLLLALMVAPRLRKQRDRAFAES